MFKKDLVEAVAKVTGETKASVEKMLNATLDCMKKALKKGDKVTLMGFGTFDVAKRAARKGRNPQTGKEIKISARKVVRFKVGSELKKTVN